MRNFFAITYLLAKKLISFHFWNKIHKSIFILFLNFKLPQKQISVSRISYSKSIPTTLQFFQFGVQLYSIDPNKGDLLLPFVIDFFVWSFRSVSKRIEWKEKKKNFKKNCSQSLIANAVLTCKKYREKNLFYIYWYIPLKTSFLCGPSLYEFMWRLFVSSEHLGFSIEIKNSSPNKPKSNPKTQT